MRRGSGGNPSDILRHCTVTRHALSRSSRASLAGAARPRQAGQPLTDDRRVHRHRPNQINIPPVARLPPTIAPRVPSSGVFFLPSSSSRRVPTSRLQFSPILVSAADRVSSRFSRSCLAPETRCLLGMVSWANYEPFG